MRKPLYWSRTKPDKKSCGDPALFVEAARVELFRVLIARTLLIPGTATTAKRPHRLIRFTFSVRKCFSLWSPRASAKYTPRGNGARPPDARLAVVCYTDRHSARTASLGLENLRIPAAPERRSFADCYRHPIRLPTSRSAGKLWSRALQIHSAWKDFLECRPAPCWGARNSDG